ncbi:curli production assembly/transport protein CsgG [Burkholderiaceae bacterium DAT-1]|nr:curli production assembly/transport protein CsgG [Burkholderiaceae bacterium DAT-1]
MHHPYGVTLKKWLSLTFIATLLAGCASNRIELPNDKAVPLKMTESERDLRALPKAKGKVFVSVYAFRDQTGQFKPAPESVYSTAVTQGATAWLVKALSDSGWFMPVERENLQNLLTERKIWRAVDPEKEKTSPLPQLTPAPIVIEGAVTSYESDVSTGGHGIDFMGYKLSDIYRADQVTVTLRAVNVRDGVVLANVISSKKIWSSQFNAGVFRYVAYNRLLQMETGYTRNEPAQLCVKEAIEAAVTMLVAKGIHDGLWTPEDVQSPQMSILEKYREESGG